MLKSVLVLNYSGLRGKPMWSTSISLFVVVDVCTDVCLRLLYPMPSICILYEYKYLYHVVSRNIFIHTATVQVLGVRTDSKVRTENTVQVQYL